MLQRERHEAEQAICDCRELCSDEAEFEDLVQKNVAANASMNYESFASLLINIAETRIRAIRSKPGGFDEGNSESLMLAYEAKMACAAMGVLVEKITNKTFVETEILRVMDLVKTELPKVNFNGE